MRAEAYAVEATIEATHWWFVGRRELFARNISTFGLRSDAPVLDIGTSTGTNLRMLRDLGMSNVRGLDFSPEAIRFCRMKGLGEVTLGEIGAMPFPDASFDLAVVTDVIEHVDDDRGALAEVWRVLRPNGKAILTVPAFKMLWGHQDDLSMHKRRYRMQELVSKVESAGFLIRERYYFNYLLFFPILLARRLMRRLPAGVDSENQINSPVINAILGAIFRLDVRTAKYVRPPFGVSLYLTVEKPA